MKGGRFWKLMVSLGYLNLKDERTLTNWWWVWNIRAPKVELCGLFFPSNLNHQNSSIKHLPNRFSKNPSPNSILPFHKNLKQSFKQIELSNSQYAIKKNVVRVSFCQLWEKKYIKNHKFFMLSFNNWYFRYVYTLMIANNVCSYYLFMEIHKCENNMWQYWKIYDFFLLLWLGFEVVQMWWKILLRGWGI
jgi:hypothetical protein